MSGGRGAIKHKGAPTIIYHCTDSPFRLAPLATHPLSGGGQEKHGGEGRLTQNLASSACQGRGTTSLPQISPPPACRGGGGPRLYLKSCLPPLAGGGGPRSGGRGLLQLLTAIISTLQSSPLTFSLLFRRPLWTGNT